MQRANIPNPAKGSANRQTKPAPSLVARSNPDHCGQERSGKVEVEGGATKVTEIDGVNSADSGTAGIRKKKRKAGLVCPAFQMGIAHFWTIFPLTV